MMNVLCLSVHAPTTECRTRYRGTHDPSSAFSFLFFSLFPLLFLFSRPNVGYSQGEVDNPTTRSARTAGPQHGRCRQSLVSQHSARGTRSGTLSSGHGPRNRTFTTTYAVSSSFCHHCCCRVVYFFQHTSLVECHVSNAIG